MRTVWYRVMDGPAEPQDGFVATVIAGTRPVCLTYTTTHAWTALDNRCPHQGGPLGEGQMDGPWLLCPWHGYEYDPKTGEPPEGYGDCATPLNLEVREDGIYVEIEEEVQAATISDQLVATMLEWGVDTVFGMVGHSNLGFADAMRKASESGELAFFGIRHEGAAAFAASAYGKLTGRPAACFGIAGPGSTNLLTGLWDAKMDRAPILALCGQVDTQVVGPGAFQEVDLATAFEAVCVWGQTVLRGENASDLMALAVKHATVQQGPTQLILPNEVQEAPAPTPMPMAPREGRMSAIEIQAPAEELDRALKLLEEAERPAIIVGHGARWSRELVLELAEHIDAPVITTFKGKGIVPDDHPLGCGVLGRSGTPVGSSIMGASDVLLVLGASFANHTGISVKKKIIQVDIDRMTLGKFHPVDVPLWGEIGRTVEYLKQRLPARSRESRRESVAKRWAYWRAKKNRYCELTDARGRMHPARLFRSLSTRIPANAVICVDVGNNTYSFGRFFESRGQDVLMSGYLGSIGFALPAAMGAWAAVSKDRPIVSISGDGGLGQYLAELTTLAKYEMNICHIVLNNEELGKISKEQRADRLPVWETKLHNPNFAELAELCGLKGIRVESPEELDEALEAGLQHAGPCLIEVLTDPSQT